MHRLFDITGRGAAWPLAVVCALGGSAQAATLSTLAEAEWEGQSITDGQGPSSQGPLSSTADAGSGVARATLETDGRAALAVGGGSANGQRGNTLLARTVWSETFSSAAGGPQRFSAQLDIPSLTLFISDDTVAAPADRSTAWYDIELLVNGVVAFASGATLSGNTTGHDFILSGTEFGGTGTQAGSSFRFDFDSFTGSVALGDFAAGAVIDLVYTLEVGIDIPGFEIFADASLADPLNASRASIAITQQPVPLPAAGVLLLSGLFGAGVLVRRRHA